MFSLSMLLALFIIYLVARDRFKLYAALVDGAWDKIPWAKPTEQAK